MYVVVRRYTGGGQLADAMVQRRQEVEDLIRGVPGFRAYYAVRAADDSVATVTVCEDRAGTEESTRRAAEWVRGAMGGASMSPPQVTEGEAYIAF
jgi:heme-degrading monooxygenase HmoA